SLPQSVAVVRSLAEQSEDGVVDHTGTASQGPCRFESTAQPSVPGRPAIRRRSNGRVCFTLAPPDRLRSTRCRHLKRRMRVGLSSVRRPSEGTGASSPVEAALDATDPFQGFFELREPCRQCVDAGLDLDELRRRDLCEPDVDAPDDVEHAGEFGARCGEPEHRPTCSKAGARSGPDAPPAVAAPTCHHVPTESERRQKIDCTAGAGVGPAAMRKQTTVTVLLALVIAVGCNGGGGGQSKRSTGNGPGGAKSTDPDAAKVVASYADKTLTRGEVMAEFEKLPGPSRA